MLTFEGNFTHSERLVFWARVPLVAVSHYRVIEKLGRGDKDLVHTAENIELGQLVALKFWSNEAVSGTHSLERFRREAYALQRESPGSMAQQQWHGGPRLGERDGPA
jgi:serine/threonine protein kinase